MITRTKQRFAEQGIIVRLAMMRCRWREGFVSVTKARCGKRGLFVSITKRCCPRRGGIVIIRLSSALNQE